ncbi:hypothetical protein, partial [Teichococcus aerofrigidensis]
AINPNISTSRKPDAILNQHLTLITGSTFEVKPVFSVFRFAFRNFVGGECLLAKSIPPVNTPAEVFLSAPSAVPLLSPAPGQRQGAASRPRREGCQTGFRGQRGFSRACRTGLP